MRCYLVVVQHEAAGQTQRRYVPMKAFTKKEAQVYAVELVESATTGGAVTVIESYIIEPAAFAALNTNPGVNA